MYPLLERERKYEACNCRFLSPVSGIWFRKALWAGKVQKMKSQEVALYREIQKSTENAMAAMDTLSDKVYDDQLAMQVSRQSLKYSEIHNMAVEKLLQAKAELYHGNHLSDILLKGGIHYNTMLNTSTGHIAEMMIKNSNQGILSMNKALNHNEEAGEQSTNLAKQLIDFEEKNIARLKKYL